MIITKEVFQEIVEGITLNDKAVNFKFGYWTTVANELLLDGKSPDLAAARFPLIYMHADFEENIQDWISIKINPTLYIITQTDSKYNVDERLENIYKPILYPIYLDLINGIKNCQKFVRTQAEIPHTRKDLFYLQNKSAAQNNLMSIIDAVEIRFSELTLYKNNCYYKSV